ncbi:MAG: efflux RND transporter permease subunit [Planctomycetota bacterium]|jgi:predicted RND superfamily exporter protein
MIGFTDAVHLVIHIRWAGAGGMDRREAARSAVRHVGRACALTSLTTAMGFGSLMISNSEEICGFGRASAIGVLITFWAVILVVPLLSSSWLGRRIHLGHHRDLVGRAMRRLSGLTGSVLARARWVATGGVLLTALLAAGALTLEPDDRLAYITPHSTEAYQAMVQCDRAFGGSQFVQVLLEWPEEASHDEIWRVLDRTEELLADEPLIRGPLSIRHWLSILPGDESGAKLAMANLLPEEYRRQFWHPPTRRALVVARVQDLGIARYEPVVERVKSGLAELERQHAGFTLKFTGLPIVRGRIVQRFVRDLAWSLALAAGVIFVVLSLAYRSLRVGLISLIPNLLPLAAAATFRATWDTSLDIASACSFAVCLGIAVDDTIHFLTRFQHEMTSGSDIAGSIRRTFVAVGNALVMTTVVMIAGFATVLTSQLPTHQSFAAMGCMTLGVALLADLVILPALLFCFFRRSAEASNDQASREPGDI